MIRTARAWFRSSNTAIAVTVGVVGGFALHQLFEAIALAVVQPVVQDAFYRTGDGDIDIGAVSIFYQPIVIELFALLLVAAVAYTLFVWPGGDPIAEDPTTTECPECKSEIFADARRCPFCTSVVTPQGSA